MNSIKTPFAILFLFLMLAPVACYSSPDITVINAKTGKRGSPPCYSFRQSLVEINTESRQYSTLVRKNHIFKDKTFTYTIYDEANRKIKEYEFPLLFAGYGSTRAYAVRDGRMAYLKEKHFAPDTPVEIIRAQRTRNPPLCIYDMATKGEKVIVPNVMLTGNPRNVFMRWISDTTILIFDQGTPYDANGKFVIPNPNGRLFIIDTVSGEQKTIDNISNKSFPRAELSPDFTMLAYMEETDRTTTLVKVIKIMKVDSGKIIKTIGEGFSTGGGGPWKNLYWSWSPDSKELAYAEGNQLKVHNIANGTERIIKTLPDDYVFDYQLVFGKDIIGYSVERRSDKLKNAGKTTLYFINANTGGPIRDITLEFNGSIQLLDNDSTFVCETGY
jgi:hypothetical protein